MTTQALKENVQLVAKADDIKALIAKAAAAFKATESK